MERIVLVSDKCLLIKDILEFDFNRKLVEEEFGFFLNNFDNEVFWDVDDFFLLLFLLYFFDFLEML